MGIYKSDFASDLIKDDNSDEEYTLEKEIIENIQITTIELHKDSKALNKRKGTYITIDFSYDLEHFNFISKIVCNKLSEMLKGKYKNFIVVGLGNNNILVDSLGPKSISNIMVTSHLMNRKENVNKVSAIAPGAYGQTGIQVLDIIKSIVKSDTYDVAIIIDALCTNDFNRLNSCIQISNTGIQGGSALHKVNKAINEDSLGIPVISIGIATVINLKAMISSCCEECSNIFDKCDYLVCDKNIDRDINELSMIISNGVNMLVNPNLF